jgi:TonB family protein
MKSYSTLLLILVFASLETNIAAHEPSTSAESNAQIPDSCKPVMPKDTVFFQIGDNVPGQDEIPLFPGGDVALLNFVKANTVYPATAVSDSVSGRVIVRFAVGPGGCPTNINILRGIREDLDKESIRVTKLLPRFKPATAIRQSPKGWYITPVSIWYMVPFNFRLKKDPYAKWPEILPEE